MLIDYILIVSGFILVFINLAMLYLFKILPKLKTNYKLKSEPLVSIIIPAKDETKTIEACINSLLNSNYKNKEIIVVTGDNHTKEVVKRFKNINIIEEPPLPEGWIGKNWACYNGYKYAKGDYLLFTDADTIHTKELLNLAVAKSEEENIGLLTLIPSLIMDDFLVNLTLPVIGQYIVVYTFAPFVNNDKSNKYFGNGQFMLFKRETYEKIGTHEAVKGEIIEDFHLSKLVKEKGFKLRLYNALDLFYVKMYENFNDMVKGWSKNLYLGLNAKFSYLIIAILALFFIYLFPFFSIFLSIIFNYFNLFLWSIIIYLFYFFRFGIMYYKLNSKFIYGFLYFIPIILFIYMLIISYNDYKKGIVWKGRIYKVRK